MGLDGPAGPSKSWIIHGISRWDHGEITVTKADPLDPISQWGENPSLSKSRQITNQTPDLTNRGCFRQVVWNPGEGWQCRLMLQSLSVLHFKNSKNNSSPTAKQPLADRMVDKSSSSWLNLAWAPCLARSLQLVTASSPLHWVHQRHENLRL